MALLDPIRRFAARTLLSLSRGAARKARAIEARYDAARTTPDNARHWANADNLSAQAANNPHVRAITKYRARYEAANNGYAKGIPRTLAVDLVGRGPRLEVASPSTDFNRTFESQFNAWSKAVRLWSKLRTARRSRATDGEVFLMLSPDPTVRHAVKWNVVLVESDRVATPDLFIEDPLRTDGIEFDPYGNPVFYHLLRQHPGDIGAFRGWDYDRIPARFMLHWFEVDRVGALRGITEFATSVSPFAEMRRYSRATVKQKEIQASITGFLEQEVVGTDDPDGIEDFTELDLEMGVFQALPSGVKATPMPASSSTVDDYSGVKRELMNEAVRPWCMSENVATCTSKDYNFSAGKLDHRLYGNVIDVERDDCEDMVLDPIVRFWFDVAWNSRLFEGTAVDLVDWSHEWEWPRPVDIDPKVTAAADRSDIEVGIVSVSTVQKRRGLDPEYEQPQILKERASGLQTAGSVPSPTAEDGATAANASGAYKEISRRQWGRNNRAIDDVLNSVADGTQSAVKARVLLRNLGLTDGDADELISDAQAGTVLEASGTLSPVRLPEVPVVLEASAASTGSTRPFSMVAYTGGEMLLPGWDRPAVVDLTGLNVPVQQRPILLNHDKSPGGIVGASASIENNGSEVLVNGNVFTSRPAGKLVSDTANDGFPWQASVGLLIEDGDIEQVPPGQAVTVNGQRFKGPIDIVRRARLREVSFCVMGADSRTSAVLAASAALGVNAMPTFEDWLKNLGVADPAALTPEQLASYQQAYEALAGQTSGEPGAEGGTTAADASATGQQTGGTATQTQQRQVSASAGNQRTLNATAAGGGDHLTRMREESAQEYDRQAQIREMCASASEMAREDADRLCSEAIRTGLDVRDVRLRILEASAPTWGRARGNGDGNWESTAAALEASICRSAGMTETQMTRFFPTRVLEASSSQRFRSVTLGRVFGEFIRMNGGHVRPGRIDEEGIAHAAAVNRRFIEAAGGFSTVSLPGLLGSAANKLLLAAFDRPESVVPEIAAEIETADFKEFKAYRLSGNGRLQPLGPDGEIRSITLTEEEYSNQVKTNAAILTLTEAVIRNDDLNAFTSIPTIMGVESQDCLEIAALGMVMSNAGGFFHADKGNLLTGAESVLSIAGLNAAVAKFDELVDKNGKPIRVPPTKLLVPPKLMPLAGQLYRDTNVNETTTANKPSPNSNPHTGLYKPVKSPFLAPKFDSLTGQSGSHTKWWLMSDPSRGAPLLRIAYLTGRRKPSVESSEAPFNQLGMQWRVVFHFGVAYGDERSAVQNNGA
jgi:capsid protein